ncbi:unnamed protein product [Schistosoma turkestanicum]|nr:unnamed protein product [Schistosoma turkestanicum]
MNNFSLSILINNDMMTTTTTSTTTSTTTQLNTSSTNSNNTCIDHFPWLEVFHQNYQPIHVYLCLILCPIGVIANTLNVVVLCQPRLRSPTNYC